MVFLFLEKAIANGECRFASLFVGLLDPKTIRKIPLVLLELA